VAVSRITQGSTFTYNTGRQFSRITQSDIFANNTGWPF